MISSSERVSYRTRYLNFPSTMVDNVPSISKPTVHVIKIRFNNVFKNEKIMFAAISVALSIASLFIGLGLYSMYKGVLTENVIETPHTVAMNELNSIRAEDAGMDIMNKMSMPSGMSGSQQSGSYFAFNNGGGIDPNSMLLASGKQQENDKNKAKKEVLTSKKAVVDIDEKISMNPFLPTDDAISAKSSKNPNFLLPPTTSDVDTNAKLLLQTSVSGIMYDPYSPSAILRINNTDYLVKKGDTIMGYNVLNISQKSVVVKYGANVFDAPVGRALATLESTNNNSISNLNYRFGGASLRK